MEPRERLVHVLALAVVARLASGLLAIPLLGLAVLAGLLTICGLSARRLTILAGLLLGLAVLTGLRCRLAVLAGLLLRLAVPGLLTRLLTGLTILGLSGLTTRSLLLGLAVLRLRGLTARRGESGLLLGLAVARLRTRLLLGLAILRLPLLGLLLRLAILRLRRLLRLTPARLTRLLRLTLRRSAISTPARRLSPARRPSGSSRIHVDWNITSRPGPTEYLRASRMRDRPTFAGRGRARPAPASPWSCRSPSG